ncbi:hypothetical protein ACJX0J_015051, partial [Zea mays]
MAQPSSSRRQGSGRNRSIPGVAGRGDDGAAAAGEDGRREEGGVEATAQRAAAYKRLSPSVTAAHVADLFRAPVSPLDPATALAFFEWVARRPGFRHTAASHAALLQLLARRRAPANYDKLVLSMISCSGTAEDVREAVDAIQAIRRVGGKRLVLSPKCYNLALRSLLRFDMTEYMGKLYSHLVQEGLLPDTVTYNTMIMAYCKKGSLAIAHRYFCLLRESGMQMDTYTCNALLLGYCRTSDLRKACWLLMMMPLMGCRRNEYSYTILIQGLYEARCVREALVLVFMMVQDGCSLNLHMYTLLIKGLCKEGRIHDARGLLDEMPLRGVVPSVWTYNAMIDGYCKSGRMKDALGIKALMEQNGCNPDDWTYNSLIYGLCGGKLDEAEELLNGAIARGFTPTVITFTNLINGYCKAERIDDALRVKSNMISSNCKLDLQAYGVLINVLIKKCRLKEAKETLNEMFANGLAPNVVIYTSIIDGYCKVGMVGAALEVFKLMEHEGCHPNAWTYGSLIYGLIQDKKLHKAMALITKMQEDGITPGVIAYTTLIQGQCKKHEFDNAFRLFEMMEKNGLTPDEQAYNVLTDALCKSGRAEEAYSFLVRKGVVLTKVTYTSLVDGFSKAGNTDFAAVLIEKMVNEGLWSANSEEKLPDRCASVFGVSSESMQCSYDSRGNSFLTILLMMQRSLYEHGGLQKIARKNFVRDQLNNGIVPDGVDVHCLAGLIKAWFREMPRGVLDSIPPEQVMQCQSEEDCAWVSKCLPLAEAALLDWAVNLMDDVVQEEQINKMNDRNIAMVFMADPLTALMYAVQVMNFLKMLVQKTLKDREESTPEDVLLPQKDPSDENGHQKPSVTLDSLLEDGSRRPSFAKEEPLLNSPAHSTDD